MYDQRPYLEEPSRAARVARLAAIGVAGALAVTGLAVGAYTLGAAQTEQPGAPAGVSTTAPTPGDAAGIEPQQTVPTVAAGDDPVVTAVAWLHAYRTLRHDDPVPTAWIDHVRPVVTDELAEAYEDYRDGGVGGDWGDFVAQGCVSTVVDAAGVIPEEAPRTRSEVNVQVAGTLRTRCADAAGERPDEALAATLTLSQGDDGLWRVDERLF